jgi:hypothetical protein
LSVSAGKDKELSPAGVRTRFWVSVAGGGR